ncbi:MAG: glycosyltransferase [Spirochaetes bacterium]|nr:glycosyltransferase [Spirochaetota bacterium]
MPRYQWGRYFAAIFDRFLFKALKKVNVILACADSNSIDNLIIRSGQTLSKQRVIPFPTRVNTNIFYPADKYKSRKKLGIDTNRIVIVSVGRINRVKGWQLIFNSFKHFIKKKTNACLIYVGDGEDKPKLLSIIKKYDMLGSVFISGFQSPEKVATYLNAADLFVVGSYKEGWSLSMLEALACGKPIVSTYVSGVKEMICEGVNGFILKNRDPKKASNFFERSLVLTTAEACSLSIAEKYSLNTLSKDLSSLWPPLS